MLYFILYVLIGLLAVYGSAAVHIITAERNGYAAIAWWNNPANSACFRFARCYAGYMIGLIIWPVQLTRFWICTARELLKQYDLK